MDGSFKTRKESICLGVLIWATYARRADFIELALSALLLPWGQEGPEHIRPNETCGKSPLLTCLYLRYACNDLAFPRSEHEPIPGDFDVTYKHLRSAPKMGATGI